MTRSHWLSFTVTADQSEYHGPSAPNQHLIRINLRHARTRPHCQYVYTLTVDSLVQSSVTEQCDLRWRKRKRKVV